MIPKRLMLQVHQWCGLAAAVLVLCQALTGVLLVFRDDLALVLDPAGMLRRSAGGSAPVAQVLAAARDQYPGFEVQRLAFPQSPRATYLAHLANEQGAARYVSVDPGTAQVLRAGGLWSFPTEAALQVHYRLLTGRAGLAVVMLVGLSVITMAVTGLIYWWPRAGRWRRSLEINWRLPGRAVLRQLHRAFGVVAAAVALLAATTGLTVAGEFFLQPGPLVAAPPPGPMAAPPGDPDRAVAAARQALPDRRIRDIRMPAPGAINVFFWAPEKSAHAVHRVQVEMPGGRVADVMLASQDRSLWPVLLPIHSGDAFGALGGLVMMLGGVSLAALSVTGPLMWLQRRAPARPRVAKAKA